MRFPATPRLRFADVARSAAPEVLRANESAAPTQDAAVVRPGLVVRVLVALVFALVAAVVSWRAQYIAHAGGSDHVILYKAAKILLSGGDPYQLGKLDRSHAVFWRFFYPLPGIALGLPFVWLTPENAAIAFVACSALLLGFAATRDGFHRVPMLFSVPFLAVAQLAQSTALILALSLIPATRALSMLKPNLGLAVFAWKPAWRNVLIAAAIFLGSALLWPSWPRSWLVSAGSSPAHHAPALVGIGGIALLSILRWRRPEGRLLFAMTIIPHGLYFYDELPLWLVADTRREAMLLSVTSWLGWLAWNATSVGPSIPDSSPWSVASLYLPALVILLRRPNVGPMPSSIERAARHLPDWLKGSPT